MNEFHRAESIWAHETKRYSFSNSFVEVCRPSDSRDDRGGTLFFCNTCCSLPASARTAKTLAKDVWGIKVSTKLNLQSDATCPNSFSPNKAMAALPMISAAEFVSMRSVLCTTSGVGLWRRLVCFGCDVRRRLGGSPPTKCKCCEASVQASSSKRPASKISNDKRLVSYRCQL